MARHGMYRRSLLFALPAISATRVRVVAAELGGIWARHDPSSKTLVDHGTWAQLLQDCVRVGPGGAKRFSYGAVNEVQRGKLGGYLTRLAATPVSSLARPEQKAFWINLYNAAAVQLVLAHYPVGSIRDIEPEGGGVLGAGPWRLALVRIEGRELSLDDILHGILRPQWRDPRVLYATCMAAIGSPDLQPAPFLAAGLDEALDEAAMAYVNDPRGLTIEDGQLRISALYRWFEADFGGSAGAVIRHLMACASPDLAMRLQGFREAGELAFDWRLNDTAALD